MQNKDYLQIMKDEQFIQWKLRGSPEQDSYRKQFLMDNPDKKESFDRAEALFSSINFSSYQMSEDQKSELTQGLIKSLEARDRKRRIPFVRYAAAIAAVALLVLVLTLFVQINNSPQGLESELAQIDCIVGSELNEEDVLLIAAGKTVAFGANVDVEIGDDGVATVKEGDHEKDKIDVDNAVLNRLVVPYGKRSTLLLADGTRLWLNSGTILEFPTQFNAGKREINLLQGEIFAEVKTDKLKPFYVRTSGLDIKVYGTKFNVSKYLMNRQTVVLVEGRVGLKPTVGNETMMKPNQLALLTETGAIETQMVDVAEFVSWRNGYLLFDNTPMSDVLLQIERYYNIVFDYDKNVSLSNKTCTGKIVLSDKLDNVMTAIALLTETEYVKENNKIIISNQPK